MKQGKRRDQDAMSNEADERNFKQYADLSAQRLLTLEHSHGAFNTSKLPHHLIGKSLIIFAGIFLVTLSLIAALFIPDPTTAILVASLFMFLGILGTMIIFALLNVATKDNYRHWFLDLYQDHICIMPQFLTQYGSLDAVPIRDMESAKRIHLKDIDHLKRDDDEGFIISFLGGRMTYHAKALGSEDELYWMEECVNLKSQLPETEMIVQTSRKVLLGVMMGSMALAFFPIFAAIIAYQLWPQSLEAVGIPLMLITLFTLPVFISIYLIFIYSQLYSFLTVDDEELRLYQRGSMIHCLSWERIGSLKRGLLTLIMKYRTRAGWMKDLHIPLILGPNAEAVIGYHESLKLIEQEADGLSEE